MFYVFSYTPSGSDTETAPHVLEMHLSAGVIHQVDVLFQDGCSHEQIVLGGYQLWPSNREESLRGNATAVSFREFFELEAGENVLKALIWTTLSADFKEVIIQIGVLPKGILQPLSFEELLRAAQGL
jgi:hypothetical protein